MMNGSAKDLVVPEVLEAIFGFLWTHAGTDTATMQAAKVTIRVNDEWLLILNRGPKALNLTDPFETEQAVRVEPHSCGVWRARSVAGSIGIRESSLRADEEAALTEALEKCGRVRT